MNESLPKIRLGNRLFRTTLLGLAAVPAFGQSGLGLFGNTHIGGGGQLYSAYPAILLGTSTTERTDPHGLLALSNAAFYNAGPTAFIDGYVHVASASTVIFPLGYGNVYAPLTISSLSGTGFDAAYTAQPYSDLSVEATSLEAVSGIEFWDVIATGTGVVSLSWQALSNISALTDDLSKLTVAGWNGTHWVGLPGNFVAGSNDETGTITTTDPVDFSQYSVFTFGKIYEEPVNGVEMPQQPKVSMLLKNGQFALTADRPVKEVTIYDLTGKKIAGYKDINATTYNALFASATGIYAARLVFTDGTAYSRKLANQ